MMYGQMSPETEVKINRVHLNRMLWSMSLLDLSPFFDYSKIIDIIDRVFPIQNQDI